VHGAVQPVGPFGKLGHPVLQRMLACEAHDLQRVLGVDRHPLGIGHAAGLAAQQHVQVCCDGEFVAVLHG